MFIRFRKIFEAIIKMKELKSITKYIMKIDKLH